VATDLVSGLADNNGFSDVFLRDLAGGTTRILSATAAGNQTGNQISKFPFFGGSNRVFFASDASDLTAGDANGRTDVFAFDVPPPPPPPPPLPPPSPPLAAITARAVRRRGKAVVLVFDAATGRLRQTLVPFRGFAGRLQLALGDLNGDGDADLLVSARVHGKRRRKAFNALDLSPLPLAPV
jgi:FG-GAP repeat